MQQADMQPGKVIAATVSRLHPPLGEPVFQRVSTHIRQSSFAPYQRLTLVLAIGVCVVGQSEMAKPDSRSLRSVGPENTPTSLHISQAELSTVGRTYSKGVMQRKDERAGEILFGD
jgi:hypothetical protein